MRNNRRFILLLFAFMLVASSFLFAQELTLQTVLKKAIRINPNLLSLEQLVQAKKGAMKQAGVRPNPHIGASAGNRTQVLTFEQELEYPGKRRMRTMAAAAGVEIAEARRELAGLQIQQKAAEQFFNILWGQQNIELLQQNLQVNEQFLQAAVSKLEQGFGSELDVVKARVEVIRAKRLLQQAKQKLLSNQNQLKTLLKIPFSQSMHLQADLSQSNLANPENLDSLVQQALRVHPAILLQQAELKAARFQVVLTRLSAKPNFDVGFEGGIEEKQKSATLNINMPLALWDKKKGAQGEALSRQKSYEYRLENVQDNITRQLITAFRGYQTSLATAGLFDTDLLNKAKEAAVSAQKAFETGGFRFLDLIDAQRTYLEAMQEYYQSLLSLRLAEIHLQIAAGQSILGGRP